MRNEELIVKHIKYAFGIVNARRRTFYDYELADADSEALLALVIAGERFDPEKSPNFHGWVRTRINGALMDWSTSLKQRYGMGAGGLGEKLPKTNPFCQLRYGMGGTYQLGGQSDIRPLIDALGALPVRLSGIIRRHYVDGQTQAQIAVALGISQCRVQQLMKRAHDILRGELALRGVKKTADLI